MRNFNLIFTPVDLHPEARQKLFMYTLLSCYYVYTFLWFFLSLCLCFLHHLYWKWKRKYEEKHLCVSHKIHTYNTVKGKILYRLVIRSGHFYHHCHYHQTPPLEQIKKAKQAVFLFFLFLILNNRPSSTFTRSYKYKHTSHLDVLRLLLRIAYNGLNVCVSVFLRVHHKLRWREEDTVLCKPPSFLAWHDILLQTCLYKLSQQANWL